MDEAFVPDSDEEFVPSDGNNSSSESDQGYMEEGTHASDDDIMIIENPSKCSKHSPSKVPFSVNSSQVQFSTKESSTQSTKIMVSKFILLDVPDFLWCCTAFIRT